MEAAAKIEDAEEYEQVFQQYLEICNRAIEQNKGIFPYTEIWGARLEALEEDMKVQAIVFDDRPKVAYMLRFTKAMKIEIVQKNAIPPEDAWPFTYQYLKRVVENPQDYIDNPAKLEWGWMQPILGSKDRHVKPDTSIRLAEFIRKNTKQIIAEWEIFAHTLTPAANHMTSLALRDHIQELLDFIVADIESPQTSLEQIQKSKGKKEKNAAHSAAETHAALRLSGGFNIDQMVSEYRALRASVIKLWSAANRGLKSEDAIDLTRFNESIDQELAESVSHYTQKVSYSKDLFMGILSHDLRSPLNVISMSAQLLLNAGSPNAKQTLDDKQVVLATQIFESTSRVTKIVDDLLDVTRARFGAGLPVIRATMDMGAVSRQLVDEMLTANPTRTINLNISGDVKGAWDKARIGQVLSNLIGNAIQYSFKDSPINVVVKGSTEAVFLSVQNLGVPIPPEKIATLFDALTRASTDKGEHIVEVNLGLGLYITEEIVVSHGGTVEVKSTKKEGTTFTAHFPRAA
jgi:signal transduction histidine kinase